MCSKRHLVRVYSRAGSRRVLLGIAVLPMLLSSCRFGNAMPNPGDVQQESAAQGQHMTIDLRLAEAPHAPGMFDGIVLPTGARAIVDRTYSIPSPQSAEVMLPDDLADIEAMTKPRSQPISLGNSPAKHPLAGGFLDNPPKKRATSRSQLSFQPEIGEQAAPRARLKRHNVNNAFQNATESATKALKRADEVITSGIETLKEKIGVQQDNNPPQEKSAAEDDLEKTLADALSSDDASVKAKDDAPPPERQELAAEDAAETAIDEITEPVKIEEAESDAAEPDAAQTEVDDQPIDVSKAAAGKSAKDKLLSGISFGSYSILHEGIVVLAILAGFFIVTWMRLEYEYSSKR